MKKTIGHYAVTAFWIILGNFFYAATVQFFMTPINLVTGGVTGISIAMSYITGHSLSGFVLIMNIFFLIVGWILLGRRFAISTLLSTFSYPISLAFLEHFFADYTFTTDPMLCAVFSGFGVGVSLGIVMRQGGSTGGMDIPPLALHKYFRIPVSVSMYVFDFIVILAQIFVFPMENLMYGIIAMVIYTIVLDKMLLLGTTKTEIKVVSKHSAEIRDAILTEADRGVTMLYARGGYSDQDTEVVYSVISNRELTVVDRLISSIDPEAFVIITRVSEVHGRGFTLPDKTPEEESNS